MRHLFEKLGQIFKSFLTSKPNILIADSWNLLNISFADEHANPNFNTFCSQI